MPKRSLLTLVFIALLLTACSSKAAAPTIAPSTGQYSSGAVSPDMGQPAAPRAPEEAAGESGSKGSGFVSNDTSAPARLVIKNAELTIVVPSPTKSMETITKMAESMNGFVVTSNSYRVSMTNGGETTQADITVRVPAERLDEALTTIKKEVKNADVDVVNENITGQDVTKEYTDLQSRQRNLEQAEQQLREIMASATKPQDVLDVFNQLTSVREQIEVIKGQIQYYEESARLSAISVHIKAEAASQPIVIGGWQPVGVAREAVQTLLDTLQFIASALIWIVLYVLPIALVIFLPLRLIWVLIRRWRQRRKVTPPPAPASPD